MSSRSATNNITIERYADWVKVLTVDDNAGDPVNIGAGTFVGSISLGTGKPVIASFAFTILNSGTDGQVRITLSASESRKLVPGQKYRYEIVMTLSSLRRPLIKGTITVDGNITPD